MNISNSLKRTLQAVSAALIIMSADAATISLLDSVNNGSNHPSSHPSTDFVTTVTDIDLNDEANFLVVVVTGESFNMDSVTFGGQAMTRSAFRDQSYTKANIYTLANPNLSASQTLSVQADFYFSSGAHTIQYFSFSNVASIGDAPDAGSASGSTINLDFGSVEAGSYLFMTGADNSGGFDFAGNNELYIQSGSSGGWLSQSAGQSIGSSSGSTIISATSGQRLAAAGIELIAVPEPSTALLSFLGLGLLLRRRRCD